MPHQNLLNSADDSESPSVNNWVLTLIDFGDRRGRKSSAAVVAVLILFIGLTGYFVGPRFSLYAFYLVPIILSALWFGWQWGCALSVACILVRVGVDLANGGDMTIGMFWNRVGHLSLYLVLVGLLHALISLQRQLELRVRQRTAALGQALLARDELQRQLFQTASRERSSIGHELHDGLGQHLTATSLAAKMLSSELEATGHSAAPHAKAIVRMAQDGIAQTRQIARGLLLATIEPERLASELEDLCENLQKEHGITCRFSAEGTLRGLDVTKASHLFYIAHEAARNAVRHAQASEVAIELKMRHNVLELGVTDNGSGLPPPDEKLTGMGLRIMAHRSELIGGDFEIAPGPVAGARVRCRLSLASAVN